MSKPGIELNPFAKILNRIFANSELTVF